MSETMTKVIKINDINREEIFNAAYAGSYYTIIGCGGELAEWTAGYTQLLEEFRNRKADQVHNIHGC